MHLWTNYCCMVGVSDPHQQRRAGPKQNQANKRCCGDAYGRKNMGAFHLNVGSRCTKMLTGPASVNTFVHAFFCDVSERSLPGVGPSMRVRGEKTRRLRDERRLVSGPCLVNAVASTSPKLFPMRCPLCASPSLAKTQPPAAGPSPRQARPWEGPPTLDTHK